MSTNEPPRGDEPGGDQPYGQAGGYPSSGGAYSGYHEGRYGEPVPNPSWNAAPDQGRTGPGTWSESEPPADADPYNTAPHGANPYNTTPYNTAGYGGDPYPVPSYGSTPPGPPGPPWGGPPPGWGPGQPMWVPPRPTNGMAVASMVLGILWIWWIGSVLALIFGYVARSQIRQRGDAGDGMAIAGIVLGWVGVGILALFLVFGLAGSLASIGR